MMLGPRIVPGMRPSIYCRGEVEQYFRKVIGDVVDGTPASAAKLPMVPRRMLEGGNIHRTLINSELIFVYDGARSDECCMT